MSNTEDKARVAKEIISQLGGMGKLVAMTGARNFIALPNGVSFRIPNPRANYIKVTLNSLDLYDLEVGRIRANKYTVVAEEKDLYNNMLKPAIEKATGFYLSLENGGVVGKDKIEGIDIDIKVPYDNGQFNDDEVPKILILKKFIDFDSVSGHIKYMDIEDNTNLSFYKNGNLVFTLKGDYNEVEDTLPVTIKMASGDEAVFNYHPFDGMGGVNLNDFTKGLSEALKKINTYSAVVSVEGYSHYVEKLQGEINARNAIKQIKENTRFEVVKGDVDTGKLIDSSSVVESFESGGNIRFVSDEDKYKTDWGRKGNKGESKVVGSFDIKHNGRIWDGYLFELDDFDKSYYAHIKLKDGEKLYRYSSYATDSGNIFPIIKVNVKKGLVYFLVDLYSDDDKNLVFNTVGIKPRYISLSETEKMENGGSVGSIEESLLKMINKEQEHLSYYIQRKEDLTNKVIRPSKIIGTGFKPQYARKLAFEWLDDTISESRTKLSDLNSILDAHKSGQNVILYELEGKGVIKEVEKDGYVTVYFINGMNSAYSVGRLAELKGQIKIEESDTNKIYSIDELKAKADAGDEEAKEALEYLKEELKLNESEKKIESFADLNNPDNITGFIYRPTGDMITHNIYDGFQVNYIDNKISSIELWKMQDGNMVKVKSWDADKIGSVFSGDNEIQKFEQGAEVLVGGKADYMSLDDIADMHGVSLDHILRQAKIGTKVEREHTLDIDKVIEIVKDHLYESPDYYTKLQSIESSFENGGNVGLNYIDVPNEIQSRFVGLALSKGLNVSSGVETNGVWRYIFTNDRDLDTAIAIVNIIRNPNYRTDFPTNLNQLKNFIKVGTILRVAYNRNKPDWVGNLKTVSTVQGNGFYMIEGSTLPDNLTGVKQSWLEYPKASYMSFSPFGFTIYYPDRSNPNNQVKFLQYEYVVGSDEQIAKNYEQKEVNNELEAKKMSDFLKHIESEKMKVGGVLMPEMFQNNFDYNLDKETVSCFITAKDTGRMLMLRRASGDHIGTWALVCGGVEKNEAVDEAIKREIQEEMGVNLNYDNLIFLTATKHPDKTHHYYELSVNEEFVPTLNSENDDYMWVNMADIPDNTHPLLKKYLKNEVFA